MKYSVKAASIATGVSESRLRTWERRYGVPHPGRSGNGRREYGEDDLRVIRRMAALVASGVPASQAAAAALSGEAPETPPPAPEVHPLVQPLVASSLDYDEEAIVVRLREAVRQLGWARGVEEVIFPALERLGYFWGIDAIPSANEHFVTEIVRREIAHATAGLPAASGEVSVVLACPEDERHDLGLAVLALLLRMRGIRVYYLGGDVPPGDLVSAVAATRAQAVALSVTSPSSLGALSRTTRRLISERAAWRIFVGGPALEQEREAEAAGLRLPRSLEAAAAFIAEKLAEAEKEDKQ